MNHFTFSCLFCIKHFFVKVIHNSGDLIIKQMLKESFFQKNHAMLRVLNLKKPLFLSTIFPYLDPVDCRCRDNHSIWRASVMKDNNFLIEHRTQTAFPSSSIK